MALIKCPECGKDLSEYARECPNCGCPIEIVKRGLLSNVADDTKETAEKDENKITVKNTMIEIITSNNEPMLSSSIKKELYLIDKSYIDDLDNLLEELINEGKLETSFNGAIRYGIATGNKAIPKIITAPKMIKCPKCDNKIYENAKECMYCGLKDIGSALLENERQLQERKENNNQVKCPKCGSTQIQMVNKRWSLATGFLTNKVDRVCLNCKHKF